MLQTLPTFPPACSPWPGRGPRPGTHQQRLSAWSSVVSGAPLPAPAAWEGQGALWPAAPLAPAPAVWGDLPAVWLAFYLLCPGRCLAQVDGHCLSAHQTHPPGNQKLAAHLAEGLASPPLGQQDVVHTSQFDIDLQAEVGQGLRCGPLNVLHLHALCGHPQHRVSHALHLGCGAQRTCTRQPRLAPLPQLAQQPAHQQESQGHTKCAATAATLGFLPSPPAAQPRERVTGRWREARGPRFGFWPQHGLCLQDL